MNYKNAADEPFFTVFQFTALLFVHLNSVIIYLFLSVNNIINLTCRQRGYL